MSASLDLATVIARAREVAVVQDSPPPARRRLRVPGAKFEKPERPRTEADPNDFVAHHADRVRLDAEVLAALHDGARTVEALAARVADWTCRAGLRASVQRVRFSAGRLIGAHLVHLHDGEYRLGDKPAPVPIPPAAPAQGDLFA